MRDQVFISYSHRDAHWLQRLQVYLAPLERRGRIRRWDDTLIAPGQRWAAEIGQALDSTRVAILLVSADFLASHFIGTVELPRLLGAAEDHGVLIFPVVLDHCNFDRYPELAQFQAIHPASEPLETLAESAQKAVLARLAAAVETALGDTAQGAPAVPAAGQLVGLPSRNPLFGGRDAELAALAQALAGNRRVALCGLPGFGKSELAIEFAYRSRTTHALVCWCGAESEATLIQGLCALAGAMRLPEAGLADQRAAARAARDALAAHAGPSPWLLVLDAVEDPALLRDWLPADGPGHVVLTSRNAAIGSLAEPMHLEALSEPDATAFLLRRSRVDATADAANLAAARQIVGLAAGVPLVLDQAGAYIEETGCGLDEYAQLWAEHSRQLLEERGRGGVRGDASLWQAWALALAQLQQAHASAAELLRLYALMDLRALPEGQLAQAAELGGPTLAPLLAQPLARNAALREALRFAFVRRDAKTRRLAMHALVAAFLRTESDAAARRAATERATLILDAAFPQPQFANWATCDALAPHAAAVLQAAQDDGVESLAVARLAAELGYYLAQRVRLHEAQPLLAHAVALARRLGAEPIPLARMLMITAHVHAEAARHAEAGSALAEALALLEPLPEAALPRAHLLDRLGALALERGDYDEAAGWLQQCRGLLASVDGGLEGAEAAQCANDEAVLAFRRGDYAGARAGFEMAVDLRRRILPAVHPSLMWSLHNQAAATNRLGDRDSARALYREVLALREQSLGVDHPSVASTLLNLGLMDLQDQRLEPARGVLERALAIQLARRGPQHPDVATVRAALADLALAEGSLDDAQSLYAEVRRQRLAALGAGHEFSARALAGLGRVALARGDRPAAAASLREALAVFSQCLGTSHDETARCAAELAAIEMAAASSSAAPVTVEGASR